MKMTLYATCLRLHDSYFNSCGNNRNMNSIRSEDYFGTKVAASYTERDPLLCPPLDRKYAPHPGGVGVASMEAMRKYSNNIAQIMAETGEIITYGEVLLQSIRVAQEIQNRGITTDDIVSLCTGNHMHSCHPFLACMFLGIRVSSLDPTLSLSDTKYLLKLTKPKMLFCSLPCEEMIEQALIEENINADIVVFGNTNRNIRFSEFLITTNMEDCFEAMPAKDLFDTAVIFYSSGTTGLPKGICTTHYGLLMQSNFTSLDSDINRSLSFTTLYWISGVMILLASILHGAARVTCRKFDETTVMKYAEQYKVATLFLAPTLTHKLTQYPESCNYDTTCLKYVMIGGGSVGEKQMLALKKLLPHSIVTLVYGMTEFAGLATRFNLATELDLINSKLESSGRPLPGFSYKIADPETDKILGPNQRGELRIKSKTAMTGYYNKPEESKKAWDSEGYLCTGDVAYFDEDYCFYIVDRIKDLLKFQSWHVAPAEIESVIMTHPDVKASVVIGIPDEVDGDLPMGVVVLKPGATLTQQELADFVNEQVSDKKRLRAGVIFVENIPLTPSGKLRRTDVRDWIIRNKIK